MSHRDNIETFTYDDGSEYQGEIVYQKVIKNSPNNNGSFYYDTPDGQDEEVDLVPIR